MSDYTPTTDEVRINYIGTTPELAGDRPWMEHRPAEFNRWLAEYTRQQREEAWAEGASKAFQIVAENGEAFGYSASSLPNPYWADNGPFNIHKWADEVRKANDPE